MCGHGTIGLVATLAYLGRLTPGEHRIETSVGVVTTTLHADGSVTVANIPAYRHATQLRVHVPGHGAVHGDVAWGGNWFFLCSDHGFRLEARRVAELCEFCSRVRDALRQHGITGAAGAEIDHVELIGPPADPRNDARNFVLCPGGAYDRSPCGTGTSAKLACLAADGKLAEGETWTQESIIGSRFTATYKREGEKIRPIITGSAFITSEATLLLDPDVPFCWGITSNLRCIS